MNGEVWKWPSNATTLGQLVPVCQGQPTTQVEFGTSGMLGQPELHWEGAPQGTFWNGRRNCGQVDFGWIHPEGG